MMCKTNNYFFFVLCLLQACVPVKKSISKENQDGGHKQFSQSETENKLPQLSQSAPRTPAPAPRPSSPEPTGETTLVQVKAAYEREVADHGRKSIGAVVLAGERDALDDAGVPTMTNWRIIERLEKAYKIKLKKTRERLTLIESQYGPEPLPPLPPLPKSTDETLVQMIAAYEREAADHGKKSIGARVLAGERDALDDAGVPTMTNWRTIERLEKTYEIKLAKTRERLNLIESSNY